MHVVAPVGVTRRVGIPRMCKTGPDPNLDLPDERDDLAAAFAKRIEEEGGATQFKIKSELKNVASGLQARLAPFLPPSSRRAWLIHTLPLRLPSYRVESKK